MFVIFSIYARNKFPIDYKYMIISFSNIGRIYTFPCDITENIPESQIKIKKVEVYINISKSCSKYGIENQRLYKFSMMKEGKEIKTFQMGVYKRRN